MLQFHPPKKLAVKGLSIIDQAYHSERFGQIFNPKLRMRLMSFDNLATSIDDKVGKVPVNVTTATGLGVDHPVVELVAARAVDLNLRHHVEGDAILVLDVLLDLGIGARLLLAELVARKGKDYLWVLTQKSTVIP